MSRKIAIAILIFVPIFSMIFGDTLLWLAFGAALYEVVRPTDWNRIRGRA